MSERKGGREAVEKLTQTLLEQSRSGEIRVHDPVRRETVVITGRAGSMDPAKAREMALTAAREGDRRHEEQRRRGVIHEPAERRMEGAPVPMAGHQPGFAGDEGRADFTQPRNESERLAREMNRQANPEFAAAVERALRKK